MFTEQSQAATSTERVFRSAEIEVNELGLCILGRQIVQFWERSLMRQLAKFAAAGKRERILEIGFGLGMCSDFVADLQITNHVIIEAHPQIARRARQWGAKRGGNVEVIEDFWQRAIEHLGSFDAIIFDPYPINTEGTERHYAPIIPIARHHLRPGGRLTYLSLEAQLQQAHVQLLNRHFDAFEVGMVRNLSPPSACTYWAGDRMAIPCGIAST